MNKVIQDLVAGMKSDVNVDDILSYAYLKTTLGLNHISNQPDFIKRDGNYEAHSQFCDDIGSEFLIQAFKTFVSEQSCPSVKTEKSAVEFILKFLETADIKFFYDANNYEESDVYDDMMSSVKDIAGRTVMSLVLKAVEQEGDGLGLRAARTAMIPYFLNRKFDIQDSKYAARLLSNRIAFLQSSVRTQVRIDSMACCNPSGKPGRCIARDQQNEHKVKTTKMLLRGLHSQLTDLSVEKATVGSNILEIMESHDRQAMMLQEECGRSSHRFLSDDQKRKIRQEIIRMDPFIRKREKVEYWDKPRGMFSGLTVQQIERFLVRNKTHHKRNSPHRNKSEGMEDANRADDVMEVQDDVSGEKASMTNVEVDLEGDKS